MAKAKTEVAAEPVDLVELQAVEPLRVGVGGGIEDVATGAMFSVPSALAEELIISGAACLPLPPVLPE